MLPERPEVPYSIGGMIKRFEERALTGAREFRFRIDPGRGA
jgi:hypothetical protein